MKAMITTVGLVLGLLTTAEAALLKGPPKDFQEHRLLHMDKAGEAYQSLSADNIRKSVLLAYETKINEAASKGQNAQRFNFDVLQMSEAMKMSVVTPDGKPYNLGQIAFLTKEIISTDKLQNLKKQAGTNKTNINIAELFADYQADILQFIANSGRMLDRAENPGSPAARAARRTLSLIPDMLMYYGRDGKIEDLKGHLEVMREVNTKLAENRKLSFEQAFEQVIASRNGLIGADGKISNQESLNKILEDIFGCQRA